jgi:hypothetical protein
MADLTRRYFLSSAGMGAGLALVGWPREVRARAPLEEVQINCGFKASDLAYGRAVREQLYQKALKCDSFDAMADVVETIAAKADPVRIHELWLHVSGNVGGKYRSREYVVEL